VPGFTGIAECSGFVKQRSTAFPIPCNAPSSPAGWASVSGPQASRRAVLIMFLVCPQG
jgi:hypothetical protein